MKKALKWIWDNVICEYKETIIALPIVVVIFQVSIHYYMVLAGHKPVGDPLSIVNWALAAMGCMGVIAIAGFLKSSLLGYACKKEYNFRNRIIDSVEVWLSLAAVMLILHYVSLI